MRASTYLFVPAHEPRKVQKALAAGSNAIILDLEDAVPESQKSAARDAAAGRVPTAGGPDVWVRVNSDPRFFDDDVRGIDWRGKTGAVLPKADDPAVVEHLASAGAAHILLIIETVAGLDNLASLASASPTVAQCAFGALDFALDAGLTTEDPEDDSELMWHVRADLVLRCRAAGLPPPIDGVYTRLDDEAGLRRTCMRAQRLGYVGKLLVHPRQIAVAAGVFTPSEDELDLAREILRAYASAVREGRGAVVVRGAMVDRPVADRAKALVKRWEATQQDAPARGDVPKPEGGAQR